MLTIEKAEQLQKSMEARVVPDKKARAVVNRFILQNLRDGFCAGQPRFVVLDSEGLWSVPIILTTEKGVLGELGEVLIDAVTADLVGFTPPTEIYKNARQILSR